MANDHPAIRLESVSKSFHGRKILDEVSFEVEHGEAFCLLGRSGMGKSVTLRLIIGLLKPDSGRIFIEEHEVARLKPKQLSEVRTKTGFLFQNGALFDSISVGDNVAFPLRRHTKKSKEEIRSIVREKLKDVELEKEVDKAPAELSGGMRKRAALARALAMNPGILLVDEPSSGLDSVTAAEIYQLLLNLKEKHNVTLLCVTHDAEGTRKFADRFAVLDKGKLTACGSPDELEHSGDSLVRSLVVGKET